MSVRSLETSKAQRCWPGIGINGRIGNFLFSVFLTSFGVALRMSRQPCLTLLLFQWDLQPKGAKHGCTRWMRVAQRCQMRSKRCCGVPLLHHGSCLALSGETGTTRWTLS